ncbi:hypothetical protein LOK49_LG14G00462 [Camellia lanceoleosa]|uniref:Uncharacterized protein n=1 Tax=Camellia lanceoleosa TaxID=1840588 RepID=A0ACC0FB22_9ERIC|nr:hypothetical protein LOK49_LG14G00462 [Camellia lanceoleosa]
MEGNQIVVGDVVTPGFMKSLSGPEKDAPGLNLEVLLSKAHVSQCGNLLGHRYSELSDPKDQLVEEDEVQNSKDIAAHDSVVKEFFGVATCSTAAADQTRKISIKEKGKGMVKYQRKKKGDIRIGVGSVLNFRKGAIFRSAVAAISLSMASKSASMAVTKSRSNGGGEWDLSFRRALFQWEVEELRKMKELLQIAPELRYGVVDGLS